MTLGPFGDFGTGYDTGAGLTPPLKVDDRGSGSRRRRSSSSNNGIGNPDPSPDDNGGPQPMKEEPAPAAVPGFSYTVKAGNRVDFLNTSLNAIRYDWTFYSESGLSIQYRSEQQDLIRFFPESSETKTYRVVLRAYNKDGDFEEIEINVVVQDLDPVCDFTYIISGTTVRFTDISTNIDSGNNFWSFGDLSISEEFNPHHTYNGNGVYNVTLTRGSFSKTKLITIDAEVVLECDAVSGATGYKWERSANGVDFWEEFADTGTESLGVTEAVHGIDSTVLNYFRVKAYNGGGESGYSNITNVRCE